MNDLGRKFLYRIFCIMALIVAIYLMIDFYLSRSLDVKVIVMFGILIAVIFFGLLDWSQNYALMRKQEQELKIYQHYIQPLEELTKDIRAKQHEFDNHMNAILNMHVLIDNYDELVAAQSKYCKELYEGKNRNRANTMLLRISDKILAGFLYSKILRAPEYLNIEIQVMSREIITSVSDYSLVEIIGTLVDNAIEACNEKHNKIRIYLDSKDDKLLFRITNEVENLTMAEVSKFFQKGYSTKEKREGHGLGLYQANMLAKRHGGEITVELMDEGEFQEISFEVEI